MAKKITGIILIVIGLLPFAMRFLRGGNIAERQARIEALRESGHAAGPAQHFGPLAERAGDFGPFLIIIPIILVVIGVILLTHKEKAVKK